MGAVDSRVGADVAADGVLSPRRAELLDCDLVMKGGVTSGFVYPKAVVRVAREYQVRNVGGTSVGAIAAALTAAAEYQRQRQDTPIDAWSDDLDEALETDLADPSARGVTVMLNDAAGFAGLYDIPTAIGDDLLRKFQPNAPTKPLYAYLFEWIQRFESKPGKVIAAIFLGLWLPRIASALLAALVFGLIRVFDPSANGRFSLIVGLLLTVAAIAVARKYAPELRLPLWAVALLGVLATLLLARFMWFWLEDDAWSNFASVRDTMATDSAMREELSDWKSLIVDLLPLMLMFWIAGAVAYLVWAAMRILPDNDFGICSGLGDEESITNWIHARLNTVAGHDVTDVLTFGHLERHGIREAREVKDKKQVVLEMIGTDIVRGVPLDLPRALSGRYLFKPDELARFFPASVVNAMTEGGVPDSEGRYRFPPKEQMPVLVATRMSMSFPVLFSAVPVWYTDSRGEPWRTWISDGGIVSNFPSNKFDRSLPPWPTFGLDLVDVADKVDADTPRHDQYMWKWLAASGPYSRSSHDRNPERLPMVPLTTLPGFLMGAVNAARGWIDNSQKRLPGFAERIVTIKVYKGEGGLNLNMDEQNIHRLARRGLLATDQLLNLWKPELDESQWKYHRWVRLRTLMRELEEIGREWKAWYTANPGGLPLETFSDMTETMPDRPGASGRAGERDDAYPYPVVHDMDRARASLLVDAFDAFAEQTDYGLGQGGTVEEAGESLGENASAVVFDAPDSPSPNPTLLMMPPFQ